SSTTAEWRRRLAHQQQHASARSRLPLAVLAGLSITFALYAMAKRLPALGSNAAFAPGFLIPGILCMSAAVAGFGWTWKGILEQLDGNPSARGPLLRGFFHSWLARYIPGTVPFLMMRVEAAQRLGYSRGVVLASV